MASDSVIQSSSPLIQLRSEIWRLILKKLTLPEALNLRFVNKDFNMKLINLYEDWVIRLHDKECPFLDTLLDLRVIEVIGERICKPDRTPGVIFKFPDLLMKLSLRNSTISARSLHILLQSKNLKSISILLEDRALNNRFWKTLDPQIGYNFPHLHTLNISLASENLLEGNIYEKILTLETYCKMRSFTISLYNGVSPPSSSVYRISSALLFFLGRHGQTLKHFTYNNYFIGKFLYNDQPSLDESAMLKNCTTLETLEIVSLCESDVLGDTWGRLIRNQTKLINIEFCRSLLISNKTCAKICAENFETLSKIRIHGLKIEGERFDMSVFEKCVNLKQLSLCRRKNEVGNGEMYNLSSLPAQIEILWIGQIRIYSQDFVRCLNKLNCLSGLRVNQVGTSGPYGVNVSAAKAILNHGWLKEFVIAMSSINIPENSSELAKLNEAFSELGYEKVDMEFSLNQLIVRKRADSNSTCRWVEYTL